MKSFLLEYWEFLRTHKKWFLAPLIAILLFLAAIILIKSDSLPTYFLYSLF